MNVLGWLTGPQKIMRPPPTGETAEARDACYSPELLYGIPNERVRKAPERVLMTCAPDRMTINPGQFPAPVGIVVEERELTRLSWRDGAGVFWRGVMSPKVKHI